MPPLPTPPPSLSDFLLAASARSLYRAYVRALRRAPPHAPRGEARDAVRAGFRASAGARGDAAKHAQQEGRLQLKRLTEMMGMSG